MAIDKTTFQEYLTAYGADISAWPEEAQLLGRSMQQHPECAEMLRREKQFELLLREDRIDPMPPQLVHSIVAKALSQPTEGEPRWLFFRLPPALRAASLALMLIVGFAIGYGAFVPEQDEEALLQSYSDDTGAAL